MLQFLDCGYWYEPAKQTDHSSRDFDSCLPCAMGGGNAVSGDGDVYSCRRDGFFGRLYRAQAADCNHLRQVCRSRGGQDSCAGHDDFPLRRRAFARLGGFGRRGARADGRRAAAGVRGKGQCNCGRMAGKNQDEPSVFLRHCRYGAGQALADGGADRADGGDDGRQRRAVFLGGAA